MKAKLLLASVLFLELSNPFASSQARDRFSNGQACQTPIRFRLGTLDSRFGITREEFQRAVEEAGDAWETAAGRRLFRYDTRGALEINLVYDSRQETTQRLTAVRAAVSDKLKEVAAIKRRLRPLQDKLMPWTIAIRRNCPPTSTFRMNTTRLSRKRMARAGRRKANINGWVAREWC